MDLLLICVRAGLALVFIAAAVGKLVDQAGARRALRDFGVPSPWVIPAAWGLPAVELATAAALLAQPFARAGALVSLVLLVVFVFGVANALRQGRAPDCHCFGQLHSAPAGPRTVVRNVALALPAALVLVAGPGTTLNGAGAEGTVLVAVSALAVGLALAVLALLRQRRSIFDLDVGAPLERGTPAPELRLRDAHGSFVTVRDVVAHDRPTVLVFVAPSCGPCKVLLPRLEHWRVALADRVALVLISSPPLEGGPPELAPTATPHTLWDVERAAMISYRLPGTPAAVLVDADGAIASAPAMASEAIEALIRVARRPRMTERRQAQAAGRPRAAA